MINTLNITKTRISACQKNKIKWNNNGDREVHELTFASHIVNKCSSCPNEPPIPRQARHDLLTHILLHLGWECAHTARTCAIAKKNGHQIWLNAASVSLCLTKYEWNTDRPRCEKRLYTHSAASLAQQYSLSIIAKKIEKGKNWSIYKNMLP